LKPLRLLIIGFGNVAQRLCSIISSEKEKYSKLEDINFEVIGIFTRSHGFIVDENGIDITTIANSLSHKSKNYPPHESLNASILKAIRELDYDVLVELTTLEIENKGEPAVTFVKKVLSLGKHVVTANKGPAAFAYAEINDLAKKNNCMFLCESAVMDGAPILNYERSRAKRCLHCWNLWNT
jgi:homoserine dehydrogenase